MYFFLRRNAQFFIYFYIYLLFLCRLSAIIVGMDVAGGVPGSPEDTERIKQMVSVFGRNNGI
jgi:hypothetical protein